MTFENVLLAIGMLIVVGFLAQFVNILEVVVGVRND